MVCAVERRSKTVPLARMFFAAIVLAPIVAAEVRIDRYFGAHACSGPVETMYLHDDRCISGPSSVKFSCDAQGNVSMRYYLDQQTCTGSSADGVYSAEQCYVHLTYSDRFSCIQPAELPPAPPTPLHPAPQQICRVETSKLSECDRIPPDHHENCVAPGECVPWSLNPSPPASASSVPTGPGSARIWCNDDRDTVSAVVYPDTACGSPAIATVVMGEGACSPSSFGNVSRFTCVGLYRAATRTATLIPPAQPTGTPTTTPENSAGEVNKEESRTPILLVTPPFPTRAARLRTPTLAPRTLTPTPIPTVTDTSVTDTSSSPPDLLPPPFRRGGSRSLTPSSTRTSPPPSAPWSSGRSATPTPLPSMTPTVTRLEVNPPPYSRSTTGSLTPLPPLQTRSTPQPDPLVTPTHTIVVAPIDVPTFRFVGPGPSHPSANPPDSPHPPSSPFGHPRPPLTAVPTLPFDLQPAPARLTHASTRTPLVPAAPRPPAVMPSVTSVPLVPSDSVDVLPVAPYPSASLFDPSAPRDDDFSPRQPSRGAEEEGGGAGGAAVAVAIGAVAVALACAVGVFVYLRRRRMQKKSDAGAKWVQGDEILRKYKEQRGERQGGWAMPSPVGKSTGMGGGAGGVGGGLAALGPAGGVGAGVYGRAPTSAARAGGKRGAFDSIVGATVDDFEEEMAVGVEAEKGAARFGGGEGGGAGRAGHTVRGTAGRTGSRIAGVEDDDDTSDDDDDDDVVGRGGRGRMPLGGGRSAVATRGGGVGARPAGMSALPAGARRGGGGGGFGGGGAGLQAEPGIGGWGGR